MLLTGGPALRQENDLTNYRTLNMEIVLQICRQYNKKFVMVSIFGSQTKNSTDFCMTAQKGARIRLRQTRALILRFLLLRTSLPMR